MDSLRARLLTEAKEIVQALQGDEDTAGQQLQQWDRIRCVGSCCNIIRELNRAKLES